MEQVRELALELPEGAFWVRCDRDERSLLVASRPDVYYLTPHFEASPGYLLVRYAAAEVDDVRERLLDAWLLVAPKRLAAELDG